MYLFNCNLNSSFKFETECNILFKGKSLDFKLDKKDFIIDTLNNLIKNVLNSKYLIDRLNTINKLANFIYSNFDYIKKKFKKKNQKFLVILFEKNDKMIRECYEIEIILGTFIELENCKNSLILLNALNN